VPDELKGPRSASATQQPDNRSAANPEIVPGTVPIPSVNGWKEDLSENGPHLPAFPLCSTMGGG
jgi:hypothetical protein